MSLPEIFKSCFPDVEDMEETIINGRIPKINYNNINMWFDLYSKNKHIYGTFNNYLLYSVNEVEYWEKYHDYFIENDDNYLKNVLEKDIQCSEEESNDFFNWSIENNEIFKNLWNIFEKKDKRTIFNLYFINTYENSIK
tara:strand:+ start:5993 stop:6409 length:417 start_codon:yes stop_codon:yes gene_type:complete